MTAAPIDRYAINSVVRSYNLLKCFTKEHSSLSLKALAQKLELDRSTVYRILLSLQKCGLVQKNPETRKYALGVAVLHLSSVYLESNSLTRLAHPYMLALSQQCRESVNLTVLSQDHVLYLDKIDAPRSLGIKWDVGSLLPLYCTAAGKILLANQPEVRINRYIQSCRFNQLTAYTITSKSQFRKELLQVRTAGYARDYREYRDEVACYAAPVIDHRGQVSAAISVSGPHVRMTTSEAKTQVLAALRESAAKLSQQLGYVASGADRVSIDI